MCYQRVDHLQMSVAWPGHLRCASPGLTATVTATGPDSDDQGEAPVDHCPRSRPRTDNVGLIAQDLQARGRTFRPRRERFGELA